MTDFPATESADATPAPALVFQTEGADVAPEAYVGDAAAADAVAEEIARSALHELPAAAPAPKSPSSAMRTGRLAAQAGAAAERSP